MSIFLRQKILIGILALGVLLVASPVLAVGISVGYPNAIPLASNENLYYGASTGTLGNLILLQVDSSPKFRVDATGNIYIGPSATPICTSSGCTSTGGGTGDNLGNHTATTNLNMSNFSINGTSGVNSNVYINSNLRLAANGIIDDDSIMGGLSDDWIQLNGFIDMHSNTDSYGVIIRDKDTAAGDWLGITQVDGDSYLADSATAVTGYFLKGSGRNVTIGGNLYVNAIYGRSGTAENIWLGDSNDTIQIQGTLNMNSKKITSVAAPTLGTDAATKDYVDTAVSGATPSLNGWTFADNYFYDDGEQVIGAYDEWLRLNNASAFTNGIYTPGAFRADGKIQANGGVDVDGKVAISSDNYSHEAKSTVTNRYGYFSVRNSANARGAYFGWGNGGTSVDLVLESASLLNITGGNVAMSGNLAVSGASLTVAGKNVCLADGTNCSPSTGDNLGNHTATTNVNFGDWQAQNVNAIQLKDWDDNTGGTDSKYRLLARDGAWMFHDGGVVIGSYSNGTWTDVLDGQLIVKNSIGIGIQNPQAMLHLITTPATSGIKIEEGASNTQIQENEIVFTNTNVPNKWGGLRLDPTELLYYSSGVPMRFSVGGQPNAMYINASGNVAMSGSLSTTWWNGTYWDSNTDANIRIDKDNNGTNYFKINNGANTTVFSVNEVGSVEVNPSSLGPASFKLTRSNLVMESTYPILWGSESIYGFDGSGGGVTISAGGGTGKLIVKRSGTVYINTTTDLATNQTATLEVNGVIRSKNEKPQIMVHPTSNVQYEWQFISGRLRLNRTGTSVYADLLSFSDTTGNIGIGSAPDSVAKLNVGGEVKMDRLKINMVYRSCDSTKTCSCAANEFLVSGGAECDNGTIQSSYPQNNESTWFAECEYFGKKAPYRIRIYCMPGDSL